MFWVCPNPEPAPPACFVLLMLTVAAAKIHFEEQAIVVGTNKEGRPTRQLGLAGCFVVPAIIACSLKWIFCHLI
jgi:hypothetical protein